MNRQEFEIYCTARGFIPPLELFTKHEEGYLNHIGDDDNLFEFVEGLVKLEEGRQPDHKFYTICSVLRFIMSKARREQNMTFYWAAKLATKMAKSMNRKLEEYKRECH